MSNKYNEQKEKINIKEDELLAIIDEDSRKKGIIETPIDDTKTEYQSKFMPPALKTEARSTIVQTSIIFKKPKRQVDIVKKILKVYTNKQVGEKTFDYFWESEDLGDDE
jgi:GTP cyclohydrolase I